MANYTVIKATGAPRVDLTENEPWRRVRIEDITCTWSGWAEYRGEAMTKALKSFKERGF